MKICGIVAEYNPFHNGHFHHISKTKELLGDDTAIVCIMSGNYVQRGDLAIYEKYDRAAAAVKSGADLILELPLAACLSSAEGFAFGSVELLDKLGCTTHISFGSEHGDINDILKASTLSSDENIKQELQQNLKLGLSYASAMQKATEKIYPDISELFSSPNNTLGIAYCLALNKLKSDIKPITITRKGAGHDTESTEYNMPSASFLRKLSSQSSYLECEQFMPHESFNEFSRAVQNKTSPVKIERLNTALLSHLRRFSADELNLYCGGTDGLSNRLYEAIRTQTDFHSICDFAQTRRYPLARIRRAILRVWLDLPYDMPVTANYAKVLAANEKGREVLKIMKKTCSLPIITKPIAANKLDESVKNALNKDILADDLYYLAMPNNKMHISGNSLRKTPLIL